MILLFKKAPKGGGGFLNSKKSSAEVLSSVVKPKKAVMCHMEKIRVLGR